MFLLILLLEVVAALALGMMISAAAATPELAIAIGIPVTIISFVFAGFYSKSLRRLQSHCRMLRCASVSAS
jgi:hypothetical protein